VGANSGGRTLDEYALTCIRHKAYQLVGQAGFTRDDLEDLEQELTIHLFEQLPKFDPTRGAFSTFVDRVVDHKAADILDARFAACRDCRLRVGSIHDTVRLQDGGEVLVEDMDLDDAVQVQRGIGGRSPHEEADLRIDLERALATLTPEQRDLCLRLMTSTIAEVSAATGVPRPTLYDRRTQIRAAFERAGLREYVRRPDTSTRVPVSNPWRSKPSKDGR
jgi:RNA polymerase sigma-70 factor (ECF subfamily)